MRRPLDQLGELRRATGAAFEAEIAQLRPILEREARFQAAIDDLDAQSARANTDLDLEGRLIGADAAWKSLADARRRALNIELARARAQKLERMQSVKTKFGRREAAQSLVTRETAAARGDRARRQEITLQDLVLWQRR